MQAAIYALGDLDTMINDHRKVFEVSFQAREYFFLDTPLLPLAPPPPESLPLLFPRFNRFLDHERL